MFLAQGVQEWVLKGLAFGHVLFSLFFGVEERSRGRVSLGRPCILASGRGSGHDSWGAQGRQNALKSRICGRIERLEGRISSQPAQLALRELAGRHQGPAVASGSVVRPAQCAQS